MVSTKAFFDVPTDARFKVSKTIEGYQWLKKDSDGDIEINSPIRDMIKLEDYDPNDPETDNMQFFRKTPYTIDRRKINTPLIPVSDGLKMYIDNEFKKDPVTQEELPARVRQELASKYLLHDAASQGRLEDIKRLVKEIPINQQNGFGQTPLCTAARYGHLEVVQWLAKNGGSVVQADNDGMTPLCIAAYNGHLEVVQWLAANGGSVVQASNVGASPLFSAALNGHLEVVQWLAANGGSVNQASKYGASPLYTAAFHGHLEVVQWLAKNGGSVVQADMDGETPLYVAAHNGQLEVVQWLAANGGSVVQASNVGRTPLYVAAENGHLEVVKILVEHGANIYMGDSVRSPLQIAKENGHGEIVKYLNDLQIDVLPWYKRFLV